MSEEYKLEKGFPTPPRGYKYPLSEMKIGDSFFVPCEPKATKRQQNNILGCARSSGRKGMKFTARKAKGGVRCWRIK